MYTLLDRVHKLFTGVLASDVLADPIEEGTPGTGTMSDFTIFAGLDRLPAEMPDHKYPYLVLEPGTSDQTYDNQGIAVETIDLSFSVLVEGQQGALFGRADTAQKGIVELHDTVKAALLDDQRLTIAGTLSPYACKVQAISAGSFVTSADSGVIYSRGCDMTITYVRLDWTGQ